jgi:hypothetical protein
MSFTSEILITLAVAIVLVAICCVPRIVRFIENYIWGDNDLVHDPENPSDL